MTDEELVRAAVGGDQDAYTQLYKRTVNLTQKIVFKILSRHPDRDDAPHDITVKILSNLDNFKGDAKFTTWAITIGRNYCFERIRRGKTRNRCAAGGMVYIDERTEDHRPFDIADERDEFAKMDAAWDANKILPRLSPGYRSVLELRYFEDLKMEEVAERLGMNLGTVKSQQVRGIKRARKIMDNTETVPVGETPVIREKEWKNNPITKTCACRPDCDATFTTTSYAQKYFPGHSKTMRSFSGGNQIQQPIQYAPLKAPPDGSINIRIPVASLDRIWQSLPSSTKARVIEQVLSEGNA